MAKFQRKILVTLLIDENCAAMADETAKIAASNFRRLYVLSHVITVKSATIIPNYRRQIIR